jgi:Spy/CpxP family protein refolding chaperone
MKTLLLIVAAALIGLSSPLAIAAASHATPRTAAAKHPTAGKAKHVAGGKKHTNRRKHQKPTTPAKNTKLVRPAYPNYV